MASKNLTFQFVILRKVEGQTSPFFSVYSSPSIAFFSCLALSKVARKLPSSTKIIAALQRYPGDLCDKRESFSGGRGGGKWGIVLGPV